MIFNYKLCLLALKSDSVHKCGNMITWIASF
jgi:hypothetical protein